MTRTVPVTNPALASIHHSLQRQPLNASRSFSLDKQVYGLQDGAPILRSQEALLPRTGIQTIDQANERVTSITQFGRQAVGTTFSSTFKGSLYGGMCGLLIAALSQRTQLLKVFQGQVPKVFIAICAGLSLGGAAIGGGLGFLQSVRKNLSEGRKLLLGQATQQAKKAIIG